MKTEQLTEILSFLCCLIHVRSALMTIFRSGFRNGIIVDSFSWKALQLCFPNFWVVELTRLNSGHRNILIFSILYFTIHFRFLSKIKRTVFAVVMLSIYLTNVNWKSRNVDGNFTNKLNYSLDRRSFGMLRSVVLKLVTSVSGQSVGQIFKGPAVEETSVT